MYCLLYYDKNERNEQLNYPFPKVLDIVILDESLELQESKQFLFPCLEELSKEALLNGWKTVLESVVDVMAQAGCTSLILPTKNHFMIFLILKKKFKLHVGATWIGAMEQLLADNYTLYSDFHGNSITIESMISIVRAAGAELLTVKTKPAPAPVISKEEKAKIGMKTCDSYSHIVDTRTNVYHSKGSLCLERVPFDAWQGVGRKPAKRGFTPCHLCYGKTEHGRIPVINSSSFKPSNSEKQTEHRLIDGQYGSSKNIFARCHILLHRGYLTKALIKKHKCLEKKCFYFEMLKPDYWLAFEKTEEFKTNERAKRKEEKRIAKDRDTFIRDTLEDSGCVYVTSIRENDYLIGISYIYDRKVDLLPEIQFLRNELGKTIKLQARVGTAEAIEKLIKKPRRELRQVTDVRNAHNVGDATRKRLAQLGVYCLEDLFGLNGDTLYKLDCELSGKVVNRRFLNVYRSAVDFANNMEILSNSNGKGCE